MSALETRIAAYLTQRMPHAEGVTVDELARIHGGSSQETFRLRAQWREDGKPVERRLILRRQPPAGLVEAERDLEYRIYRALADTGLPVPFARYLEMDAQWLDRPFFMMDLSPGKPGHPYVPGDPYDGHGEAIARQFWHHLGTLAAMGHVALGLDHLRNGKLREDGLMVHDLVLVQVKTPEESKAPWDYYKILATIKGEDAFGPPDPACTIGKK